MQDLICNILLRNGIPEIFLITILSSQNLQLYIIERNLNIFNIVMNYCLVFNRS